MDRFCFVVTVVLSASAANVFSFFRMRKAIREQCEHDYLVKLSVMEFRLQQLSERINHANPTANTD